MNKLTTFLAVTSLFLAQQSLAQAAEVEVAWTNPEKYTDIDAGDEHKKHFQSRVFRSLEKHFAKLASKLPEGQTLKLNVTNVDLAGDVNLGGIDRIRIIKSLYFPKMKFSYQLLDANKQVIKSDDVALKNMSFMSHSRLKYHNRPFGYEKEMLDDWFRDTFLAESKSS